MGVRWAALASIACVLCWSRGAPAQPDNRPGDRFFFGPRIGIAGSSPDLVAPPGFDLGGLSVGYETSYWPNDYLGFGFDFQLVQIPANQDRPAGTNIDLGLPLLVGVPLRYIQPYAGVWLGLAHTYLDGVGLGVRAAWCPVAGVNGYLNRNLRLYLQWQSVSFDYGVSAHAPLVTAGVRWSPDFFHRTRPVWKFQTVWWSLLGTFTMWGVSSLVAGD